MGIAEGIVVGAMYGGVMASILGGFFGMILGSGTAALSWQVRRQIPLVLLALSVGFLIEVGGCLLIVVLIKVLTLNTLLMWILGGELAILLLLRLLRQYRGFRSAKQAEGHDQPE